MRCEKCKYQTKTTCQCQFGYEQASKEFLDGNCEKFVDKYKEEYTPIIASEIFEDIKKNADIIGSPYVEKEYRIKQGVILELKKKYIGE